MVNKALDVKPSDIEDQIFNSWEFIVSEFMGCVLDTILELAFWDGHVGFIGGDAGGHNLVAQILFGLAYCEQNPIRVVFADPLPFFETSRVTSLSRIIIRRAELFRTLCCCFFQD